MNFCQANNIIFLIDDSPRRSGFTSFLLSYMSHTNNGCLHVAKLTSTPMTTVKVQPTAVYHRNDNLNSGLSTNLHT